MVQKVLMILLVVYLHAPMQGAENRLDVNSVKDQIIASLEDSSDLKEIADLCNYDKNLLLHFYMKSTYDDDHDDVEAEVDAIHAQLLDIHINIPLKEILLQVLADQERVIMLQQGHYEIVGGLKKNSYDNQILNFVAQHPNYYFDIAPVVEKILDQHHYKASVIDFINRHIKIIPQAIVQDKLLQKTPHGYSRLMQACCYDTPETLSVVQFLINLGVDVKDKGNRFDQTALIIACSRQSKASYKLVQLLVDSGADVNTQASSDGWTPLMIACYQGSLEKAKILLSHGAQVNCYSLSKSTPLMQACYYGSNNLMQLASLLIELGAEVEAENDVGENVVMHACKNYAEESANVVLLLAERGANIHHIDHKGYSLLIYAIGKPDIVRFLLDQGVNIDHQDHNGATALMHALDNGFVDTIKLLIDKGANVNLTDKQHKTVLLKAIRPLYIDKNITINIVQLLLDAGADINHQCNQGMTALIWACRLHCIHNDTEINDIVRYLLDQGADRNLKTHRGKQAIDYADTDGVREILRTYRV